MDNELKVLETIIVTQQEKIEELEARIKELTKSNVADRKTIKEFTDWAIARTGINKALDAPNS